MPARPVPMNPARSGSPHLGDCRGLVAEQAGVHPPKAHPMGVQLSRDHGPGLIRGNAADMAHERAAAAHAFGKHPAGGCFPGDHPTQDGPCEHYHPLPI